MTGALANAKRGVEEALKVTQSIREKYREAVETAKQESARGQSERASAEREAENAERADRAAAENAERADRAAAAEAEADLRETERLANIIESAAERAIVLVREGNIEAASDTLNVVSFGYNNAYKLAFQSMRRIRGKPGGGAMLDAIANAAEDAYERAEIALHEAKDIVLEAESAIREREREVERAERKREAAEREAAHNEAVERASEAAERAVEDYRVIYGIFENAELAVALAERALENAENEEDYAEAWKRHREVEQYRDSVGAIAIRAEHLAISARDSVNRPDEALGYASEVANLRAQVEG